MKPKALFCHISKTGGASISCAPWILLHGSPQFSPQIPVKDIDSLKFCFTFVRDPYTRFTSAVLNHGYATPENFEDWVTMTFWNEHKEKFSRWEWQELIPQHYYFAHKGKIDVDFIGRFENIKDDWRKVCKMVGEEFELPHKNKNKFPNHADLHTPKTRKIVKEVYLYDFTLLEYKV